MSKPSIVETERLQLREITLDDAPFILGMLNDPDWLRFIGDRGVRTLAQARAYILRGPIAMYARYGYGLWLAARKSDLQPIGLCGLLRRDGLDDADLGFAVLPAFRNQGYTLEASAATLRYAREVLRLRKVAGITSIDNQASARVLERLGFMFERTLRLPGDDEELKLFAIEWQS
jgi:RimJ/RimL family protein N-acetyltransferase